MTTKCISSHLSDQQHQGSVSSQVSDGRDKHQLKRFFFNFYIKFPPAGRSCASCKSGAAGREGSGGGGSYRGGNSSDLATTFTRVVTLPGRETGGDHHWLPLD